MEYDVPMGIAEAIVKERKEQVGRKYRGKTAKGKTTADKLKIETWKSEESNPTYGKTSDGAYVRISYRPGNRPAGEYDPHVVLCKKAIAKWAAKMDVEVDMEDE